ncbi:glycosyltransferase family 2 protein [Pseudomonas sp. GG8]
MATYNGERYLVAQLESLLLQTHTNWKLYVSDDGSVDNTVKIAKDYMLKDSRITVVNTDRQGGVVKNFDKALSFSKSDHIMFCDQDDIWMPAKISSMLAAIKEKELEVGAEKPVLAFSDLCLVDEKGSVTEESFYESNKLNPIHNLDIKYLSWRSTVYGCTVIVNRALLMQALPLPSGVPMHDQWLCLIALHTGAVVYVDSSTIYYRQHANNVVGGAGSNFFGKLISIKKLLSNVRKSVIGCINQNSAMQQCLSEYRTESYIDLRVASGRFVFLKNNVIPYWKEKKSYTFFFLLFMLLDGR